MMIKMTVKWLRGCVRGFPSVRFADEKYTAVSVTARERTNNKGYQG